MNSRITVLHIIKNLSLGGAEVNLLNLVQATDSNRFELHITYSGSGELEEKFVKAGVKLYKFADKDYRVKSLASLGIVSRLASYVRKHKIDIVHTHTFSAHLWGAGAAKLAGCKLVEHVHDFRYLEPDDFARRRGVNNQYKFIRYLKNISDRVIVLTRQNREFLVKERLYLADKVREYQNGIPLDGLKEQAYKKKELISKFSLPVDAMIILTPIRIAPEKNADLIVRIAPEVVRQVPNAVFLIAGDGPLCKETGDEIKKLGLEKNIKMIGYHSDIKFLLEGSDVFLLPSFLELHSIAILEAMSMGVPIVVSLDVGCNSDVIQQWENGVLLDPFEDKDWAEAIIKLLKDHLLRKKLGQGAYQTCVDKFDITKVIKKFENLYVELKNT